MTSAFVTFQKLFNAQLSDSSALGPQLDALTEQSNQVNAAGIEVKPQLLALLMINALSKSYQTIAGTILTTQTDVTLLTAALIKPKIVEEEQRRVANCTQIAHILKAPLLDKKCEKCGHKNHTTEQHWDTKLANSGSSSGNGNNT
ncbi:uncharacterized protein PHACADRAFT_203348 [Phanerochaete carnosa HHB-10118-sp]|uniref:Uncharacterized protein n=1 Tax=Phanerochaete carnosa (strain HHB-10118-sp) TaxID=650164 RepID=K5UEZ2_PHACS|nr:uncharacterized protein PHACADRAFT_203348 [Phanerochaete carnosa HHB-10118-sp]EKM48026.1 hypothetical protein PHACADRAFT_203348 [Phanerochaete carnosa HHB-10118-sp]